MKPALLIALALICLQCAGAEENFPPLDLDTDVTDRIESVVSDYRQAQYFSGEVLIAKADSIIYHKAFGLSNREKQDPYKRNQQISMVFKPFRMDSTSFSPLSIEHTQIYDVATEKVFVNKTPLLDVEQASADGSLYSTAEDLLKFWNGFGIFLDSVFAPASPIAKDLRDTMRKTDRHNGEFYSLGFMVYPQKDFLTIAAEGGGYGNSIVLKKYLRDDLTVIILANNITSVDYFSRAVYSSIYKNEFTKPKKRMSSFILEQIDSFGIEKVKQDLSTRLQKAGYEELSTPMVLIRVAESLGRQGQYEKGHQIHELNASFFPSAPETYNSRAEFYAAHHDLSMAKEFFLKAQKVNAGDEYATRRMRELGL
jgi:hypothetical protein